MWCYVVFNVNGLNFSMLFTILQFLRSYFVERSNLGLFVSFSWLNSGCVVFFGQEYHRTDVVPFPFFHIGKDLMWIFPSLLLLTFDHWLRWCLLGLSFVKLLFFFSCLISIIWGDTLRLCEYFSFYFYIAMYIIVIIASINDFSLQ